MLRGWKRNFNGCNYFWWRVYDQLTETETFNGTTWTEVGDMAVKAYNMGAAGVNNTAALACGGAEGAPQATTDLVEEWSDPVYTIKTVTVS